MPSRSPFNMTDWVSHGLINSSHTSNLTMVYEKGALPTPWPWVVGSIVLSVLLGSVSVWTSWTKRKQDVDSNPARTYNTRRWNGIGKGTTVAVKRTPPSQRPANPPRQGRDLSNPLAAVAAIGVVISTVRALVALILAARVLAMGRGSYSAPSAFLILMTSLHISITNLSLQPAFTNLVQLGFLLAWIADILNFAGGTSGNFYGNAKVVGGSCAFP